MRRLTVFMVLGVLAALVTGSVLALPQAETVNTHVELAKTLEDLLLEQEQGRLAYEAELRQAGKKSLPRRRVNCAGSKPRCFTTTLLPSAEKCRSR